MKYNLSITEMMIRYILMTLVGGVAAATVQLYLIPVALYFFLTAILGACPVMALIGKRKPIRLEEEEASPEFT